MTARSQSVLVVDDDGVTTQVVAFLLEEAGYRFEIATTVRRFKSEHNLSLGSELASLQLATGDATLRQALAAARTDLSSITRAKGIQIDDRLDGGLETLDTAGSIQIALAR